MIDMLRDIPKFKSWKVIKRVNKGYSNDIKYFIENHRKENFLLRISKKETYQNKLKEFEFIKKCNKLFYPMSKAIEIGYCNNKNNVYMLLTWVDGKCLGSVIDKLSENRQYELGVEAGKILKNIHSIKVSIEEKKKNYCIKNKILDRTNFYENQSLRVDGDIHAIDFIKNNIESLTTSTPCYKHGDFHIYNLILTPHETIGIIDFNRWRIGDKYEEFYKIQSFEVEVSVPFSIGKIHGYFNNNPPKEFWSIHAVYVAYSSIYSIVWAKSFGDKEINDMKKRCVNALLDYNNFDTLIPNWYTKNSPRFITFFEQ